MSNLAFLGKVIERCAAKQIIQHIENNDLMEPHQSAYRKHHSTETCLLKIKSDILEAMDKQMVTCVLLLDASAAFDTISHKILLERLSNMFGLRESVLSWIESYITGRKQKVVIGDHSSEWDNFAPRSPPGIGPGTYSVHPVYMPTRKKSAGTTTLMQSFLQMMNRSMCPLNRHKKAHKRTVYQDLKIVLPRPGHG